MDEQVLEKSCNTGCNTASSVEALNSTCFCLSLDKTALDSILKTDLQKRGLPDSLPETHPHLFSPMPMFISQQHLKGMAQTVKAIEAVLSTQKYKQAAMQWSAEIARFDPGSAGGLLSYDFHLSSCGPQLIEINTNPGGALLTTVLAQAQLPCCRELDNLTMTSANSDTVEKELLKVFMNEWNQQRRGEPLTSMAIIDDSPEQQYLYPEFLLYEQLFRSNGIDTVIGDPHMLERRNGKLLYKNRPIDFVYNRLTDFTLELPEYSILREAYLASEVVVSPHPYAHSLYADKRNLTLLSDERFLHETGVSAETVSTLLKTIPRTEMITNENRDALWSRRKHLFFKPATGYGSKAVYRGDKLTKRVWDEVARSPYVAQELVMPSQRQITDSTSTSLKADIRNYTYRGDVILIAARLYQGQATNFRTPFGGFAPVFTKL